MKTSITPESLASIMAALPATSPPKPTPRQPVHTIYGGAHLFTAATPQKLGAIARRVQEKYAPDASSLSAIFGLEEKIAERIFVSLQEKLSREPVEDLRIDFEDGYGQRSASEEDEHAVQVAAQIALALQQDSLPPFFGIRIKALTTATAARAIRTLDLLLNALLEKSARKLPNNFVITLPKIDHVAQVETMVAICEQLEGSLRLPPHSLRLELMIETPRAICNEQGINAIPALLAAAHGRCQALHFGAFDYTASCGISGAYQDIRHPACDFARHMILVATAHTDIWLADGVTTQLPLEPHRGENLSAAQNKANQAAMHRTWKIHYDNVRLSCASGFYQSWDLHPAQLIPRYVATYAFFQESLALSAERLRNFSEQAARATTVGTTFDDAASVRGLCNYFVRALNCGAFTATEIETLTGLTTAAIQAGLVT